MKKIAKCSLYLASIAFLTSIAPSISRGATDAWKDGDLYGAARIHCTSKRSADAGNVTEINLNGGALTGTGIYFRIRNNTGIDTPITTKLNSTNGVLIGPKADVKHTYYNAKGDPVDGINPRNWGNYMMLPANFDGFIYMDYATQMSKIGGTGDFDADHIWRIYIEYSGFHDSYADFVIGDIYTDQVQALDTSSIKPADFSTYFVNDHPDYNAIDQLPRTPDFNPVGDLKGGVGCVINDYTGFMIKLGAETNLTDGLYVRFRNDMDQVIKPMIHVASDWFKNRVVTDSGQIINLYDDGGIKTGTTTVDAAGYFALPANFDGFIGFDDYEGFKDDWGTAFDPSKVVAVYFESAPGAFSVGDIMSRTLVAFDGSEKYHEEFSTFTETWGPTKITLTHLEGYKLPEVELFDYTTVEYGGSLEEGANIKAKKNDNSSVFSTAVVDFPEAIDLSEGEAVAINFKANGSYAFQMEFVDEEENVLQLPAEADAATKPIYFIKNGEATAMNHKLGDPNTIHEVPGEGVMVLQKDFLAQKSGEGFDWSKVAEVRINVHTFYDSGLNIVLGDFGTVDQTELKHTVVFKAVDVMNFAATYKALDEYLTVSKFFTPGPSKWIGDVKLIDSLDYKSDEELKANVTYDIGDNACSYHKEDDGMFVHIGPYETGHQYGNYMCLGMFDKGVTTDRKVAYRMVEEEKEYAKGITFYAENRSAKEIGLTLQFDENIPGKGTERWCVTGYPAMYYAWDVVTGGDYLMYAKSDQVQIPVGFKGYIRVPFTSYRVPEWNAGAEGVDEVLDLDNFSGNFFLTSDNTRFEDLEYFIKNVGLYFNETQKSNLFNLGKNSIQANMGLLD